MDPLGPEYVRQDLHSSLRRTALSKANLPSNRTLQWPKRQIVPSLPYSTERSSVRAQARLKGRVQQLLDDVLLSRQREDLGEVEYEVGRTEELRISQAVAQELAPAALEALSLLAFYPHSFTPAREISLRMWSNVLTDELLRRVVTLNRGGCQVLDLAGCSLITDNGLVDALEHCQRIEVLNLAGCEGLTDRGLDAVLRAVGGSVVSLHLSGSSTAGWRLRISDETLLSIAENCTMLCRLVVSDQERITDHGILQVCERCKDVAAIDITRCSGLTRATLDAIGQVWGRGLVSVKLNGFGGVVDPPFRDLVKEGTNFVEIECEHMRITDNDVRAFVESKTIWGYRQRPSLSRLISLNLGYCLHLTDLALAWISTGCPNVRKFSVRGCTGIGNVGLKSTATMLTLETLDISGCTGISDDGIHYLTVPGSVPSLTDLDFSHLCHTTEKGIHRVVQALGNQIICFRFERTSGVSNAVLRMLFKESGSSLTLLHVTQNSTLSTEGIGALAKRCRWLTDIDLSFCSSVDDSCVSALSQLKRCKVLNLSHCIKLTSLGMNHLPNWNLEELLLCANVHLDDQAVRIICRTCHRLKKLNLSFCTQVSSTVIENHLANACASLTYLDLSGCTDISLQALNLVAHHPNRVGLHIEAIQAKHAVLDPNSHIHPSTNAFTGCKPRRYADKLRHQEAAADLQIQERWAALHLQSVFRGRRGRAIAVLRRSAAKLLQRVLRGAVTRWRYIRYRSYCVNLALKVQRVWRRRRIRKQLLQADEFYRDKLRSSALWWWKRRVQVLREERKVDALVEKLRAADAVFCQRLLRLKMKEWRDQIAVWKKERIAYEKACRAWALRNWRKVMLEWSAEAQRRVSWRRKLVDVFLFCLPLETRNASAEVKKVNLAKRFFARRARRKAFTAWFSAVLRARERTVAADTFYWELLKRTKGVASMRAWKIYVGRRIEDRKRKAWAAKYFRDKKVISALRSLRRHFEVKQRARDLYQTAVQHHRTSLLNGRFQTWLGLVKKQKADRRKQMQATAYLIHTLVRKSFLQWRRMARRQKIQREAVHRMIERRNTKVKSEALHAWSHRARLLTSFRHKVSATARLRIELLALTRMRAFTETSKRERRCQFEAWEKLNMAAIVVQKMWRGVMGRDRFENLRLTWQLMAVIIQKYVRRLLAIRETFQRERKQRLREYIRAESESDAMAVEDEMAIHLVKQYKAARLVQNRYRSLASRRLALVSKRLQLAEREKERRAHVLEQLNIHKKREEEREAERKREHEAATVLQRVFRGMRDREVFHCLWADRYLSLRATKIQSVYRGRVALRYAIGMHRHEVYRHKTVEQQHRSAALLRTLVFRNRWAQSMLSRRLIAIGAHPESFTLERNKIVSEVKEDAKEWFEWAVAYARAVRLGKTGRAMKAFDRERQAEMSVAKGDAVQIVARGHAYRGRTGYVLNVYNASSVPGKEQATVKLDHNQDIIFIALKTPETKTQASSNSMIKIHNEPVKPPPYSKDSPISPDKVRQNRDGLISYADGHIGNTRRNNAAAKIQGLFRWKLLKQWVKTQYPIQHERDLKAQAKVLKRLERLHLDSCSVGRLLVRCGIILPREVPPELDGRHLAPTLARYVQRRAEFRVLKRQAHHLLASLSYQLYMGRLSLPTQLDGTGSGQRRWRSRGGVNVLLWKLHSLLPVNKITSAAETWRERGEDKSGVARKLLVGGAKVLEGIAMHRTEEDKHTWIGLYHFEQFNDSPHVANHGWALFHGAWYPQPIFPKTPTSSRAAWVSRAVHKFQDIPHGVGEIHFLPRLAPGHPALSNSRKMRIKSRPKHSRREMLTKTRWKGKRMADAVTSAPSGIDRSNDNETKEFNPRTFYPPYDSDDDDGAPLEAFVAETSKSQRHSLTGRAESSNDLQDGVLQSKSSCGIGKHMEYGWMSCRAEHGHIVGDVKIRMRNGAVYTGPFVCESQMFSDAMHEAGAKGRWETTDGVVYSGQCVTNHFNEKEVTALAIKVEEASEIYEGSLWKNKRHGAGLLLKDNGVNYDGEWVNGQRDGHGKEWRVGGRERYAGSWKEDKKTGSCTACFADGRTYEGEMEDGRMEGKGKLTTPGGDVYEGQFVSELFEGEGRMVYADGSVYKGGWKRGLRDCEVAEFEDTKGNRYEVPFKDDKMDGCGVLFEKTMSDHPLEKYCMWEQGYMLRVLRLGIHPALTKEFNSRFVHYADYRSAFAMVTAQRLPSLPPGVDPDDRSVEQHVHGILLRAGSLSCSKVINESKLQVETLQVSVKDLYKQLVKARRTVAKKQQEVHVAKTRTEAHEDLVREAAAEVLKLKKKVLDFWQADDIRLNYWKAVGDLVCANRADFAAMKQLRYPPPSWLNLWKGIAMALGEDKPTLRSFKLLCGSSIANAEAGDESAMKRDYDVKLLNEIKYFNVYAICKPRLIADLSSIVHHKDMSETNAELEHCSKLSPLLVRYFKAAFCYLRKAMDIAACVLDLKQRKEKLRISRELLHAKHVELNELLEEHAGLAANRDLLEQKHLAEEEALKQAALVHERAIRCANLAKTNEAKHLLEEQPDEAIIKPWLSREDEAIRNACMLALDEAMDLVSQVPAEIHDILTTVKETIVDEDRYERMYTLAVPQSVRDHLSSLLNQVAGGAVELQVSDALNAICQRVAPPPLQVQQLVEEMAATVTSTLSRQLYEEDRRERFLQKRVIVWTGRVKRDGERISSGFERFGTCINVYDREVLHYEEARPGSGMIYCDHTTTVFAYEDSCDFTISLVPGWNILLPSLDGEGVEERRVCAILSQYQLELDYPFSPDVLIGNWTKNWAFRDPTNVVRAEEQEVCDIAYDDGQVEYACVLERVKLQKPAAAMKLFGSDDSDTNSEDSSTTADGASEKSENKGRNAGGWEVYYDSDEDAPYWFNPRTKLTTWVAPKGYDGNWQRYFDEDEGEYYWHNPVTKKTTWTNPFISL